MLGLTIACCAAASTAASTATPAITYEAVGGYIAQGADLLNGTMTVAKAQEVCSGLQNCMGFTFSAKLKDVNAHGARTFRAQMWLKYVLQGLHH